MVLYEYDGYGKLTQTRDIYNGRILFTTDASYMGMRGAISPLPTTTAVSKTRLGEK